MSRILSFDTSNYTTSACLFDTDSGILWENRIMLPVTTGKCGLRQSEAVFLHNRNLMDLFNDAPSSKIDYVAASVCPSERTNSYMPCFLVGSSFATTLSKLLGVPLYTCSHQKNHIGAAIYSSNSMHLLKLEEFYAYHVSGGTTDILHCRNKDGVLNISKAGGTLDISCGQLIDRIGVALNFPFPCGKYVQQQSSGKLRDDIKISKNKFSYNFSGFENKIKDMIDHSYSNEEVCDYVLGVVLSFIKSSLCDLRRLYKDLPAIFSGGVMSNEYIQALTTKYLDNVYFAEHKFSLDNALGTAYMCAYERGLLNE